MPRTTPRPGHLVRDLRTGQVGVFHGWRTDSRRGIVLIEARIVYPREDEMVKLLGRKYLAAKKRRAAE